MNAPIARFPDLGLRAGDGWSTLLDDVFNAVPWFGPSSVFPTASFPALNAWDLEDSVRVEAEVPGYAMEELDVALDGHDLTLKGDRQEVLEENTRYLMRERRLGSFARTVRLPYDVDADKVEARLDDGVLTIVLPKSEAHRPRRIEVTTRNGR